MYKYQTGNRNSNNSGYDKGNGYGSYRTGHGCFYGYGSVYGSGRGYDKGNGYGYGYDFGCGYGGGYGGGDYPFYTITYKL